MNVLTKQFGPNWWGMASMTNKPSTENELEAHSGFVAGCMSQAIGRERSAIAYYRHEIRRTSYFKAHYNLARLLAKRGRLDEAITHYKEAARRSTASTLKSDSLNNLGLAYWRKGARAEAIKALQQSSRANPRSSAPRVNLALELLRWGRRDQALRWLDSAHRLTRSEPETDSWVGYALVEHDLDLRRGVRLLRRALSHDPKNWRAMADLALAYMKLGDRAKAEGLAKRAKQRAPRDAEVRRQVGLVLGVVRKGRRAPRGLHRERHQD